MRVPQYLRFKRGEVAHTIRCGGTGAFVAADALNTTSPVSTTVGHRCSCMNPFLKRQGNVKEQGLPSSMCVFLVRQYRQPNQ